MLIRKYAAIPMLSLLFFSFFIQPAQAEDSLLKETADSDNPPVVFTVSKNVGGKSVVLDSKNPVVDLRDTLTISVEQTTHPSGISFVQTKWTFLNEKKRISIPSISGKDVRFETLKTGFVQIEAVVTAEDGTKLFNKLTLEIRDPKWKQTPFGHIPFMTADKEFIFYKSFKANKNTSYDLKLLFDIKNNGNVYITPYQSTGEALQGVPIKLAYQHESDPIKTTTLKLGQVFKLPTGGGGFVFQLYAKRQTSNETFLSDVYTIDLPEKKTFAGDATFQTQTKLLHKYGTASQPLFSELLYLSLRYAETVKTSK